MPSEICAVPRTVRRVIHNATKSPPSIDLYEVTPEQHHKLRVVSSELYSVWVHQSGRRALPCYGDSDGECEHHRLPSKQQHYLYVEIPDDPRLRLLRLTSGLVYKIVPELSEVGRNVNGFMLELWREHENKYDSAMFGTVVKAECVEALVRHVPDIQWAVERILNAPDRLAPWTKRRPTPIKRARFDDSTCKQVRTPEQQSMIKLALELAKRGDTQAALECMAAVKAKETEKGGEA